MVINQNVINKNTYKNEWIGETCFNCLGFSKFGIYRENKEICSVCGKNKQEVFLNALEIKQNE
jgi:hypothetical protein